MGLIVPKPPSGHRLRNNNVKIRSAPPMPPVKPQKRENMTNEEKINKISKESPRMYYTPEEFPTPDETHIVSLTFVGSNIAELMIDDITDTINSFLTYRKTYEKVRFKNSKYPYLLVDTDQKEKFNEMFLNIKPENKRTYI